METPPNRCVMLLVVLNGKHKGNRIPLPLHVFVMGRNRSCHLRMASQWVSKKHCALAPTVTGLRVCDLKSRNGTFVNGKRIEGTARLNDGDELRVGPVRFRVSVSRERTFRVRSPEAWARELSWLGSPKTPEAFEALEQLSETALASSVSAVGNMEQGSAACDEKSSDVEIVAGEVWYPQS